MKRLIIAGLALLLALSAGCSGGAAGEPALQDETLMQVSTIDALLDGVYDGTMTYGELAEYGDFGLGTFDKLDGEMLAFDGKFYQVKMDGVAYEVPDDMTTPFAAVTFFEADKTFALPHGIDMADFETYLDNALDNLNAFYAIRIDGTFTYMKTRSVPAQEKPYPPLTEVTAHQAVFEFESVTGTIVGFRCPAYVEGLNAVGYHLHFLTDAADAGGHVLAFTVDEATVTVDVIRDFFMVLPDAGSDFYGLDFTGSKEADLAKAEK